MTKNNDQEFAWHVHGYLNGYIKFGDTKAALISGIAGPLVLGLMRFNSWKLNFDFCSCFGLLAVGAFAAAFCFAFTAIWPNLLTLKVKRENRRPQSTGSNVDEVPDKGFIYWKNILAHTNANTFANEFAQLTEEQKLKHVGHHCYELAGITDRKYWLVTVASRCFALGVIALVIFSVLQWNVVAADQQQSVDQTSVSEGI